jgi:hypothetical protein
MGLWVISWRTVGRGLHIWDTVWRAVYSPHARKQVAKVTVNLVWCVTEGLHSTLYTGKCKYDLTYKYLSRYSPAKVINMIWPSGVDTVHEVELHSSKQLEPTNKICSARCDQRVGQPGADTLCHCVCVINQIWSIGASYDQWGLMRCVFVINQLRSIGSDTLCVINQKSSTGADQLQ